VSRGLRIFGSDIASEPSTLLRDAVPATSWANQLTSTKVTASPDTEQGIHRTNDNLVRCQRVPDHSPMNSLRRFLKDEQGQDLIEYTLLMAFIALASASIFISAGGSIQGIWSNTSSQLVAANAGS
jgi:Flp pilus assembly pilin Flp